MKNSEYPALFQETDEGSIDAQSIYLRLVKFELLFLILAAFFSGIQIFQKAWMKGFSIISAISLLVAFIARIISKFGGFEEKWFSCRAIAESVKSVAWRYMMRVNPYEGNRKAKKVDEAFIEDLREIRDNQIEGAKKVGKYSVSGNDITEHMREVRNKSFKDRLIYYNEKRVQEQKDWYSEKAKTKANKRSSWFWYLLLVEGIAVILAFVWLIILSAPVKPIGFLTTMAAVIVSWSQVKKYRELSQLYNLTAQDLRQIESNFIHVNSKDEFSDYVEDVEDTISKEHTVWLAKRRK